MTVLTSEILVENMLQGLWIAFTLSWPYLLFVLAIVMLGKFLENSVRARRKRK